MKSIIITGANSNLGSVTTQTFLNSGYRVIATVLGEEDKNLIMTHPQLDVRIVDLTNEEETNEFTESIIREYSTIHGLLMLVGGFAMGNITTTTLKDLSRMISLNFETAFNISKPLFKHFMRNDYGRIVFIGAKPALESIDGKEMIAYGLSKSLLFKFAEYLNAEAKNKNITATVVVPSVLDTLTNRKNMPDVNPDNWVNILTLSEVLEFVFSKKADQLREPILKVYNNA